MSIGTVGVVGLGTMGAGIAQVCLEAGHVVVARDVEQRFVDAGVAKIESALAKRVEKGVMAAADAEAARGRLTATTDLTALSGAGIVIEAIVEELEPKQALFAELNGICGPEAILATNTSALSVSAVAAASGRPDRVVGLHFFNPAPLMKLIEVVRTADRRSTAAFDAALEFASGLGKEAVPCADTPGFLVNRILIPILNDAIRAMEETGASPEDIDRAHALRRRLADGSVRARRSGRSRRARPRVRGAVARPARGADGAAGPSAAHGRGRAASVGRRSRASTTTVERA